MDIYLTLQSNHTSLRCNKDTQARLRELAELEPKWLNASLKRIDGIFWTKLPWPGAPLHTWVPSTFSSYAFFFPLSLCWNFFSKNELKKKKKKKNELKEILPCMDYLMIWCHCIFSVLGLKCWSSLTSSHCPVSPRSGMTPSKHALNPSICRVNQTLICAICVLRTNPYSCRLLTSCCNLPAYVFYSPTRLWAPWGLQSLISSECLLGAKMNTEMNEWVNQSVPLESSCSALAHLILSP